MHNRKAEAGAKARALLRKVEAGAVVAQKVADVVAARARVKARIRVRKAKARERASRKTKAREKARTRTKQARARTVAREKARKENGKITTTTAELAKVFTSGGGKKS